MAPKISMNQTLRAVPSYNISEVMLDAALPQRPHDVQVANILDILTRSPINEDLASRNKRTDKAVNLSKQLETDQIVDLTQSVIAFGELQFSGSLPLGTSGQAEVLAKFLLALAPKVRGAHHTSLIVQAYELSAKIASQFEFKKGDQSYCEAKAYFNIGEISRSLAAQIQPRLTVADTDQNSLIDYNLALKKTNDSYRKSEQALIHGTIQERLQLLNVYLRLLDQDFLQVSRSEPTRPSRLFETVRQIVFSPEAQRSNAWRKPEVIVSLTNAAESFDRFGYKAEAELLFRSLIETKEDISPNSVIQKSPYPIAGVEFSYAKHCLQTGRNLEASELLDSAANSLRQHLTHVEGFTNASSGHLVLYASILAERATLKIQALSREFTDMTQMLIDVRDDLNEAKSILGLVHSAAARKLLTTLDDKLNLLPELQN